MKPSLLIYFLFASWRFLLVWLQTLTRGMVAMVAAAAAMAAAVAALVVVATAAVAAATAVVAAVSTSCA